MQSTYSEYGSPYLAVCHVTFTNNNNNEIKGRANRDSILISRLSRRVSKDLNNVLKWANNDSDVDYAC